MGQPSRHSGAAPRFYCARQVTSVTLSAMFITYSCPVFQPNFTSFSNIFGRRPLVLTAILFFFVGTVVASVSKNFTYMLVGRSIQGVGGGGIIALSEVIVTDLVPLRLRGKYFGILSSMWSVGSVTGPILGGGFSQNVTWVNHFCFVYEAQLTCESDGYSISIFPSLGSVSSSCFSSSSSNLSPARSLKNYVASTTSAQSSSSEVFPRS